MAQPVWLTTGGSLGVIPEGIFYQIPLFAEDPDGGNVYYTMIAGQLPAGIQCRKTGLIEGIPKAIASLQGVPQEVAEDVVSTFAVRAYTEKIVNGREVIDRLADRTFSLTVTGQDTPQWITAPGLIGTYYDGTPASIQLEYTDPDPNDRVRIQIISGTLPPGLVLSSTGVISGVIQPLTGVPGTAAAGYDTTPKDEYPNDFTTRSASTNYQFGIEISDGKNSDIRIFQIYVYSKDSMSADTTDFTADNTWITADVVPTRTPVLITPTGFIGTVRADNYWAYKFDAVDWDGDTVEYVISTGYPSGLSFSSVTGWLYGYIPASSANNVNYEFSVRVRKLNNPLVISSPYTFTMTVTGDIDTEVIWVTDSNLGVINNGATSTLEVIAINTGNRSLEYSLVSGSNSKLPQGLSLLNNGLIAGKVSFNTFALDGGLTTFDTEQGTRLSVDPTTFDMQFTFTVNASSPVTEIQGFEVASITVTSGGAGYLTNPVVIIEAPPVSSSAEQATVGTVTRVAGSITSISVANPGGGYFTPPSITILGGGGAGATATCVMRQNQSTNPVSSNKTFTVTVNRAFNEPYENLYIKGMLPQLDRNLISGFLQDQDIFPNDLIYRANDSNFGMSLGVRYVHAFGLRPDDIETYVASLDLNHYWKNLTLGQIKLAQATNSDGIVIYEAIYSQIIDNLVNNQGTSVGKSVNLAFPVNAGDSTEISTVYPNSLINMRTQVTDTVGKVTAALPAWMTSKQSDGTVLGFVPAWVIGYAKPGRGGQIIYNIQQQFGDQLNQIDFEIDRYELDKSMTKNWLPYGDSSQPGIWIPYPPSAVTFDVQAHYQLPSESDSTLPYTGGTGYAIGDRILILGSAVGGVNGINDIVVTVADVDITGVIQYAFIKGTAPFTLVGSQINNVSGTNITGTGSGATFDFQITGFDPTIFDGGSMGFTVPSDRINNTDAFDKYLMFPKTNILG